MQRSTEVGKAPEQQKSKSVACLKHLRRCRLESANSLLALDEIASKDLLGSQPIMTPTRQSKIRNRWRATAGVRVDVVEFETGALSAALAGSVDIGAAPAVAFPDGTTYRSRNVSSAPARSLPRACTGSGRERVRVRLSALPFTDTGTGAVRVRVSALRFSDRLPARRRRFHGL